ncbi:DUF2498 family protein [Vibrio hepatarius]|uniref:DUF2498 family protein n=1 Tax=Vibrio hepatarius TaxID=171383 RepID=UPI001C08CC30|nr:DUF2498 family protein [Vibrio hepatarius]MBU2895424.1 DUF2498 family protein [Vibrio hepatarius]
MKHKKIISKFELLLIANHMLHEHHDNLISMRVEHVEEKDDVLIFKGNHFLDINGLPTEKTPKAFNMLKYLSLHLSNEFTLKQS